MKPLLHSVVALSLLLLIHAVPNSETGKLSKANDDELESELKGEVSEPQTREERCTTCAGSLNLNIKSPKEVLAAIQSLPGAKVHTQQSFEGCSSDKGCAGLKLKDGKVVERFGNVDAFKTAAAADTTNEFNFQAAEVLNKVIEGSLPPNGPFWWMNKDSPFKNAGTTGSFEKYRQESSSSFSSGIGTTGAGAGFGANAALDLSANPFLNGDLSKVSGGFGSAGLGANAKQSSSFQSSSFSSNKADIDISSNPFLNGGIKVGQTGFGAGFGANQAAFGAGSTGAAQTGFGAQSFDAISQANFAGGKLGAGYTGSSPTPFAAGANVNLIQNAQKNEFDFEQQQQQAQQNIDEAFQSTGNVQAHSGGELQQTCAGQGYVCVPKSQCNNGVVNTNGAGILQANTKKQYCNVRTEICCRIEISAIAGAGNAQGSLGIGAATFQGAGAQGSGLFVTDQNAFGAQGQSSTFGATGQSNSFGAQGQSAFGAQGVSSQAGQSNFGATGSVSGLGVTSALDRQAAFNANRVGQASVGLGSTSSIGSGIGSVNRGVTASYDSTRSTSYNSNKFASTNPFGSTVAPATSNRFGSTAQSNFVETDSFSAGSEAAGIYRPGAVGTGLKPGIPYLPPVDNTNAGSNIYGSTAFPTPTFVTTPRPITTPRPVSVPRPVTTPRPFSTPRPFTTPRPFSTPKPTYYPPVPSTSAPGYLPPIGEQTINRETRLPPNPIYQDGNIILDETRQPRPKPPTPGPAPSEIPAGCAAALKCTPIEYCTAEGVISNTTVILTRDQNAYRVPLTDCRDIQSGRIGKCCRDPLYTDPWPTNQLGKWVPGVFGGNDGKYVPDSRVSPNNPRPSVTVRPPTTGSVRLDNFRNTPTPKPVIPYGPNQVTPGFPITNVAQGFKQTGQTTIRGQGQYTQGGQGQYTVGGQGQYSQGGQGQYAVGGQGQFGVGQAQVGVGVQGNQLASGSNYQGQFAQKGQGSLVSQGQGLLVNQGQGEIIRQGQATIGGQRQGAFVGQGQGSLVSQGQGSLVTQGQGSLVTQGQGSLVSQGQGTLVNQGQGTLVSRGQGSLVNQGAFGIQGQGSGQYEANAQAQIQRGGGIGIQRGQGQIGVGGQGATVSQGFGTGIRQGQGEIISNGQGLGVSQGFGVGVSQGQGQLVSQGQGQLVSQGQGQFVNRGQGLGVSQGSGAFVTNGQGQLGIQGQGALGTQGQGQLVSQGGGAIIRGQTGQFGTGFEVSQGTGQGVFQGQGSLISQGFGAGIKQGQGVAISQGSGFGVENEFGESVQRVFLSRYDGSGQCGLLNGQKPYGNRNDNEVDFAEIPWQAMVLLQTNRSLLCGGVITRPDVVITSAACVDGLEAKNVLIKGGEWKLGIDEEPLPFQIVQVKTILRHPFYKRGSLLYDAAILVLSENLRWAKNIYPICLPKATDTLDAFYNGAGECIVTGWGKQVLQAHLLGSIMHSINVSLINPGECQSKLTQDYPHLLEQYDEESCACGQPTNPLNNICRVDVGSALACTTGNGQYVMRGVYSWDSGCQTGNQIAAFYKFDLEWYEWAIGLIETTRFTIKGTKVISSNRYSGQFNAGIKQGTGGGVKGSLSGSGSGAGLSGSKLTGSSLTTGSFSEGSRITGGSVAKVSGLTTGTVSGTKVFSSAVKGGAGSSSFGGSINEGAGAINGGLISGGVGQFGVGGKGQFGFGQGQSQFSTGQLSQFTSKFSEGSGSGFGDLEFNSQLKAPITNSYSASYTEKKVFQTEPKIITYTTKPEIVTFTTKPKYFTYTTKPEIVTFTTKPEIFTYTTKPKIVTYTTKPKIVTYTTKPQIITYETSGSGTNPQYVAPGVTYNPSFSDVVGQHTHNANCKCLEGKK